MVLIYGACEIYYVSLLIFFFKQKTAYEMRISDWSSDVCSSDLVRRDHHHLQAVDLMEFERFGVGGAGHAGQLVVQAEVVLEGGRGQGLALRDRKSVV